MAWQNATRCFVSRGYLILAAMKYRICSRYLLKRISVECPMKYNKSVVFQQGQQGRTDIAFHSNWLVCHLQVFGILLLDFWSILNRTYARSSDIGGELWRAIFTAGSAFNDIGFTLTPTSIQRDCDLTAGDDISDVCYSV